MSRLTSSSSFTAQAREFTPTAKEFKPTAKEFTPSAKEFTPRSEVKEFIPQSSANDNPYAYTPQVQEFVPQSEQQYQPHSEVSHQEAIPQFSNYVDSFRPSVSTNLFVSQTLKQQLHQEQVLLTTRIQPTDPEYLNLPLSIHDNQYTSLTPLPSDGRKLDANFPTITYKANHTDNGTCYAIRRTIGSRIPEQAAKRGIQPWLQMQINMGRGVPDAVHPSIVPIRDVFSTTEFNDKGGSSLCFVYDYFPGALSLEQKYFGKMGSIPLHEDVLWSYLCQFLGALSAIHGNGLACKGIIHPTKVLVTSNKRLRLNCCGLVDGLQIQLSKNVLDLQVEDIVSVGKLMLSLACSSLTAVANLVESVRYVESHFSSEFTRVVTFLLSKHRDKRITCFDVLNMVGARLSMELSNAYTAADALRSELSKEVQNGRLFRLVVKLGFINERPVHKGNTQWSDTEGRYLLKLFRDYVFHQVDEKGNADINFGHVVDSLNQLDAGTQEKILLMSRDQDSMIIASYADMQRHINQSFEELQKNQSFK